MQGGTIAPQAVAASYPTMPTALRCRDCRLRHYNPLLAEFGAKTQVRELKIAHRRQWAGERMIEQGDPRPVLFTLFSGWAIKTTSLPSGEGYLLSVVLPGELIGIESIFCMPLRYSVLAVTDVTYCSLDFRRTNELLTEPRIARRLMQHLLGEHRRICERLAVVGACNARHNLAHFVVDLLQRLRERKMAREDRFRLPLSSLQLANALGLTTVHLNRLLRGLRQDGIMTLENHVLEIQDMAALREIAAMHERPCESQLLA